MSRREELGEAKEFFGSSKRAGGAPFYGSRVESLQNFIYIMFTLVCLCILSVSMIPLFYYVKTL